MFFEYDKEKKPLHEYMKVKDGKLKIPPGEWAELIEHYTNKEIKSAIANALKGLPFPLKEYTEQDLHLDWLRLKAQELNYTKTAWVAPRQSSEIALLYRGEPIIFTCGTHGQKVSNQYTQKVRIKCGYHSGSSPLREWENCDKKSSFLRCLFGVNKDELSSYGLNQRTLFRSLAMHTYMASQFKPSCAKALYDFFDAKHVLDFSSGWGDRLVGFLASNAQSYVGIDPNTELHEPYQKIVDWTQTDKETRFICSPAEDADLSGVKVDFIFTSPPYFDVERYSNEETQSWKRYPKTEDWLEGFLFPTLKKCWGVLEEGGRIAVNIADKKGHDVCRPMIEYMATLGSTYEGVIGYRMHKRPGNKSFAEDFGEPIFIWSKGKASEPKWTQDNFFGV